MMYQDLPETIPVHFDSHGNPNKYESKSGLSLWGLPVLATAMGLGALFLIRFPKLFNHPRKQEVAELPEHLRPQVYVILKQFMLAVFLCVDALFVVIEYGILRGAKTGHVGDILPLTLVLAAFPIVLTIYFLPRIGRTVDRLKQIASMNQPSAAAHH